LRILVTGGTGFIGSNLARSLVGLGHEVWVTGRDSEAGAPEGCVLVGWGEASSMSFDACMHQAANNDTLDGDLDRMMEANVFEPARLFHRLAGGGCRRFVYASSTAVYGNGPAPFKECMESNPLNIYATSKLAFDEFAKGFAEESESKVFGLRYCNVYGPGEDHKGRRASMVLQLARQMIGGSRPRIFRDGEQKRDWVYVEDVVGANLACLSSEAEGVFNIAGGRGVSFNHLVRVLGEKIGSNLEPEYMACEFHGSYQKNTECDIGKAREVLGWRPQYSIEAGIDRYLSFLGAGL
jgi:ADP-L-glycero-D-manno-heptose 6-epimerase